MQGVSPYISPLDAEHASEPLRPGESSCIWLAKGLSGAELLHGKYQKFAFARHFHSTPAIGVVETGVMQTYCHGRTHHLPGGTVILLNPGDVHAPQAGAAGGWSFRMLYLEDDLVRDVSGTGDEAFRFARPFPENLVLYRSLLGLHRTFERELDPLEAESHLAAGLAKLARHSLVAKEPSLTDPGRTPVERAREYLQAYSAGGVTLRSLARVAGLSPYHFLRTFRAQIGMTPHAYLVQLRIERGRTLLGSGVPIAEAAIEAGFADQSHFTRQFKRFTGVTPGNYLARRPVSGGWCP